MKNVIGLISTTYQMDNIDTLTQNRPISTLPFGGRYRLIDFALSNMVNTGISTVGLVTPNNYRSILDHIRSGKDWFLDRKNGGLFILPSDSQCEERVNATFLLKDLHDNIDFLLKANEDHVVLSGSNIVMNLNMREAINFHIGNDNDITLIYKDGDKAEEHSGDVFFIDQGLDRKILSISNEEPKDHLLSSKRLLNVAIVKRNLLIDLINDYGLEPNALFFNTINSLINDLKIYGLEFRGFVGRIMSTESYYNTNMKLLAPRVRSELFMKVNKIHTKITDHPPTRFSMKGGSINSLIGSGCKISGLVENSILFREVQIGENSSIKDSIVMQKSNIGKNVELENVILDKFAIIGDNVKLKGKKNKPLIVDKSAVIKA